MEDEFGMAQSAFGATAQNGATGAAEKAFGPSMPSASAPVDTVSAPSQKEPQNPFAGIPNMSEALKGAYDQLRNSAMATARRYLRFGTDAAPKNAPTFGQIAGNITGGLTQGSQANGGIAQNAPSVAQDAFAENAGATAPMQAPTPQKADLTVPTQSVQTAPNIRMVEPQSYARSVGSAPVPVVDMGGYEMSLGGVDTNDREAVAAAVKDADEGLRWMQDNGYLYE